MSHYKIVCTWCGKLMGQCRCPSPEKLIRYDECEKCSKEKEMAVVVHLETREKYVLVAPIELKNPVTGNWDMGVLYQKAFSGDSKYYARVASEFWEKFNYEKDVKK